MFTFGYVLWFGFLAIDWAVVANLQAGRFWHFAAVRIVVMLLELPILLRLRRLPVPSLRLMTLLDAVGYVWPAAGLALMCIEFRGIASPYAPGLCLVLLAHTAMAQDPWRRGLVMGGIPVAAYYAVLLGAALFSPRIASQLGDRAAMTTFALHASYILGTFVFLVIGGHVVWSLRQQVLARNLGRGELIALRYRVEGLLGSGGMGEVYRALDTRLHRDVALKVLRAETPRDFIARGPGDATGRGGEGRATEGVERLMREARAVAMLDHPNVVAIYDVGQIDKPSELQGAAYLAMEFVAGETLRVACRDRSVPLDERLRWLVDVARGLAAAHAQGIVHRDVKPENVMIREDGAVKVLDFGIAKRTEGEIDPSTPTAEMVAATLTTVGIAVGTPYYMAPEQMRGEALDGRADEFAWGVMAYEVLTGHGPWRTDGDALSLVSEVLLKPAAPLRAASPEIPEHVERIVLRALSKAREDRFASMKELIDAW